MANIIDKLMNKMDPEQQKFFTEGMERHKGFDKHRSVPTSEGEKAVSVLDEMSTHIKDRLVSRIGEREPREGRDYSNIISSDLEATGMISGSELRDRFLEAETGKDIGTGYQEWEGAQDITSLRNRPGSIAAELEGKLNLGQFRMSGKTKSGEDYEFDVWGEPGKYQYSAGGETFPLSDELYNKWRTNLEERTGRVMEEKPGGLTSDEVYDAWVGEKKVSVGQPTNIGEVPEGYTASGRKENIVDRLVGKFKRG